MEIIQEHKDQIEQIMSEIYCPRDFPCYKSGFEKIGKIRDIKAEGLLECLEKDSEKCQFSLTFGGGTCCLCPLRIYIASELGR
jgi:hypothetical protein